jgi:hypothetical protein
MTPADIKAARAVIEAATPGPWVHCDLDTKIAGPYNRVCESPSGSSDVFAERKHHIDCDSDADNMKFIAAARTGWPEALDEVERLQNLLEKAENYRCRSVAEAVELLRGHYETEQAKLRAENEDLKARLHAK